MGDDSRGGWCLGGHHISCPHRRVGDIPLVKIGTLGEGAAGATIAGIGVASQKVPYRAANMASAFGSCGAFVDMDQVLPHPDTVVGTPDTRRRMLDHLQ